MLRVKRVYEAAAGDDGTRVLVDRVWPRGLSKETVKADRWLRGVAPSSELRKWFGHDPARWEEFKTRYFAELDGAAGDERRELLDLLALTRRGVVTLLYSAKDAERNQAVALREYFGRSPQGAQSEKADKAQPTPR